MFVDTEKKELGRERDSFAFGLKKKTVKRNKYLTSRSFIMGI
jgi:hypothetical protein